MRYLFAMIFFNIVVGGIVMFKKEAKEMEEDYKKGDFYFKKEEHKAKHHIVVDVYSTLFWKKTMFRPKGLFQVGITIKNVSGSIQHVGIGAVKQILVVEY